MSFAADQLTVRPLPPTRMLKFMAYRTEDYKERLGIGPVLLCVCTPRAAPMITFSSLLTEHYQRAVRVADMVLDPDDVVLAETLNLCGLALQENDKYRHGTLPALEPPAAHRNPKPLPS